MTHLCLKNCSRLSFKALKDLPKSLPNLLYLDVSSCANCSSNTLQEIGKYCPLLQVLRVDSCQLVDDSGILAMCGSESQKQNACTKILELNLSSTSITEASVKVVLQSQPDIRSLSLAALCPDQQLTFNFPYMGPTKLRHVDVSYTDVTDSSIQNICRLCPSLIELSINCCNKLTGKSLEAISCLKYLQYFNMALYEVVPQIGFLSDVVPFLRECGAKLEVLDLSNVSGVDAHFLAVYCPKLAKLVLADCGDISGRLGKSPAYGGESLSLTQACASLQHLNLRNAQFLSSRTTSEHLSAIICGTCRLEELILSGVEGLTDECLQQTILSSDLTRISSLDLSHCADVSAECVDTILSSCHSLSNLNLSHCRNITLQDAESLRRFARESGRVIDILWA